MTTIYFSYLIYYNRSNEVLYEKHASNDFFFQKYAVCIDYSDLITVIEIVYIV